MAGAEAAAVFIIVPTEDELAAILDAPMASVVGHHPFGVGS
jgi:hypothetical protein